MKLKPCPFCGNDAELRQFSFGCEINVNCTLCPCIMEGDWETPEEATTAWNTRHGETK